MLIVVWCALLWGAVGATPGAQLGPVPDVGPSAAPDFAPSAAPTNSAKRCKTNANDINSKNTFLKKKQTKQNIWAHAVFGFMGTGGMSFRPWRPQE